MKHLIFDFDGTLADSLPLAVEIANQITPQLNLGANDMAKLREMPPKAIIKYCGVSYWKLPRLLIKGKKILSGRLDELKVFPGIDKMIKELHAAGYPMHVVSSNSEEIIRDILDREGVERYFSGVYGNVGLFNKTRAFKVVLKDQQTSASNAIYIGDEVRDIEAARRAKIAMVAVTWGYNGAKILGKYQPDGIVNSPKELLKAIRGMS